MPVFDGQPRILQRRPGVAVGVGAIGAAVDSILGSLESSLLNWIPFAVTQDGSDPRKWTKAGQRFLPSSVRVYLQGQRLDPLTEFTATNVGPDTVIQLNGSIAIALADGQAVTAEGVKA